MSQILLVLAFQYGLCTTNTKELFVILPVTSSVEARLVVIGACDQEWQLFVCEMYTSRKRCYWQNLAFE